MVDETKNQKGVSYSAKRLPNQEAIIHFQGKTLLTSESYFDVKAYEHALAFTVAKIADEDLLKTVRDAIQSALENGTDFRTFKRTLLPYLNAQGWGNFTEDKQLLDRRLRTIFNTNMSSSYSAGQWQRIQKTKEFLPYLKYMPSLSANKRDEHKQYYGIVRPVDDPIWQSIFPKNGYGCRCWVKQLTQHQAEKEGISDPVDLEMETVENPRTGEKMITPKGVHFSFNHNHDRLSALLKLAEEKHGIEFSQNLIQAVIKLIPKSMLPKKLLAMVATTVVDDVVLPPPSEWREVAKIGEQIYQKYADIFDKVDFDKAHDFSHAVLEVMKAEGVELGGIADVNGDSVKRVQEILTRYPKSWVDKSNALGSIFVRNMTTRGFHFLVENKDIVIFLRKYIQNDDDLKIFAKFVENIEIGDSLLKLNNIGGKFINNKAYNVTIHEFAHRLQVAIPELDEYFKQLWLDRTKGEKTRPLAEIQKERGEYVYYNDLSEVGRKDNFADVYIGKNYGTDDNPRPAEVMAMIFQQLLGSNMRLTNIGEISDTKAYWQQDKELLYLGLALLIKYKP